MPKFNATVAVLLAAVIIIGYLMIERRKFTRELNALRQNEATLRREAELENSAWKKLYTDCVNENKSLIEKMKHVSASPEK
jgi:hypothetical protein